MDCIKEICCCSKKPKSSLYNHFNEVSNIYIFIFYELTKNHNTYSITLLLLQYNNKIV